MPAPPPQTTNRPRSAIVLVLDGLSPGFLGPYGNTWVETPAFNELAAESVLIEHAISNWPNSVTANERSYEGLWNGRLPFCDGGTPQRLLDQCLAANIQTNLVTDAPSFAESCTSIGFSSVRSLPKVETFKRATDISETRFAQLIGDVIEALREVEDPSCTWVHSAALTQIWDAPLELIEFLRDEEDPDATMVCEPPQFQLANDDDPDEAWSRAVNYAAQVQVVDACLGILLQAIGSLPTCKQTLFMLTSTHGYPLGEHQWVGPAKALPYSELVDVPWFIRFPNQQHASIRLQNVSQSTDFHATLADWFGFEAHDSIGIDVTSMLQVQEVGRPVALSRTSTAKSIRTPAWHGVFPNDEAFPPQLFSKPDDRWDFNEVAQRCPDIVQLLRDELAQYESAAREGRFGELPPLDKALAHWRE